MTLSASASPAISSGHIPVMLNEVLEALTPQSGDVIVDATFGMGGYSTALLERSNCHVIGIDRDPHVQQYAQPLIERFEQRFTFLSGRFGEMEQLLQDFAPVQGVVMDIGVSSMQLDMAERGFSFRHNGTLDMRMSSSGISAADLVNHTDEEALANIIWLYGEERASRRIARAIVEARREQPITTTHELRNIIHRVVSARGKKTDPATKTFQALRISVNEELDELRHALTASERLLSGGGRLAVVAFHSLEDRIVKQFLKEASCEPPAISRHIPDSLTSTSKHHPFHKPAKARRASAEEIDINPRSRSATLRHAVRTNVPAREEERAHG